MSVAGMTLALFVAVSLLGGIPAMRIGDQVMDEPDIVPVSVAPFADAGGPYVGFEGSPIVFDASNSSDSLGRPLEYSWDFDGDGQSETGWSPSPLSERTWGDDYHGTATVEVRVSQEENVEIEGSFGNETYVSAGEERAQSFVPTYSPITAVALDVLYWSGDGAMPNDALNISVRSQVNGSDLSFASIPPSRVKSSDTWPGPVAWTVFDIPDIDVIPGQEYYLHVSSQTSSRAYVIRVTDDCYPNGSFFSGFVLPSGIVWIERPDVDIRLRIFTIGRDASAKDSAEFSVLNAPPSITEDFAAVANADITLRVAGEKWHDVSLALYYNGTIAGAISIRREPGSPNDQSIAIVNVSIDALANSLTASVSYTPADDPVNGQIWGATPAWLILRFKDGYESRLHHTFNVRNPRTWNWLVRDFRPYLIGAPVQLSARASDSGSDDLTFIWSFDGVTTNSTTYFNDGFAPDPPQSPDGVYPFAATDFVVHAYWTTATHDVEIVVQDDDGGVVSRTLTITLAVGSGS